MLDALLQFVRDTALPKPSIIHLTGHGVHAIWSFDPPLLTSDWLPLAEKLQQLADYHQLDADPITADAARILRVPGTTNFRNLDVPKSAIMHVFGDGRINIDKFVEALNTAHAELPLELLEPRQKVSVPSFDCPATPENVAILNAMLACIDPDPGETKTRAPWRNTIWAVAATGWTQAFESARNWSAEGDLWDETKFQNDWDSFDPDRQGGIGFGTLVHHAREGGYTGPWMTAGAETITASDAHNIPRPTSGLVTQLASDIEPEAVEWLIQDAIPLGTLVVLGGQPGLGKSQLAIKLAAAVTSGHGLPDDEPVERIGSAIILANEDDAARTIRPRLEAAGANLSKVHIVQGVVRGSDIDLFQLDIDIAALRQTAEQLGDVRLIIIDPPTAYLGSKVDAYKESDVRRVLAPLSQLAQVTGALVLLVVHLNKRTDGAAQQRFGGSTAWTAAPRAAFLVTEDEALQQRYMVPVKNNLGNDRKGFLYRISEKILNYGELTIKTSHIEWMGGTERLASDLLNPPRPSKSSVVDSAKEFLRGELANGSKLVKELQDAASGAGFHWSSVKRARSDMMISAIKVAEGWRWSLMLGGDHD